MLVYLKAIQSGLYTPLSVNGSFYLGDNHQKISDFLKREKQTDSSINTYLKYL